jgi:chromosome segregation ATPase
LDRLKTFENKLNTEFGHLKDEYIQQAAKLDAATEVYEKHRQEVEGGTAELRSLSEQCDQVKLQLDAARNKVSDNSCLVAIRSSIGVLESDIKDFERNIHIKLNQIMVHELAEQARQQRAARAERLDSHTLEI